MTKFLKTLLILSVFALTAPFACAVTLSADYVKEEVSKAVENDLKQQGFYDVEVKVLSVPFSTLELPAGRMQMTILQNQGAAYSKRAIKGLRVSVDGRIIRTFGVPLEIKAYQNALVATKEIKVGQSINSSNTLLKKIEVNGNHMNTVGQNALATDMVAGKLYRQGETIDKRFSKVRSDIQKDEIVTVIFDMQNNLTVSTKAKALSSGSRGDVISVLNEDNKKIYYAEVINKNIVKVNI